MNREYSIYKTPTKTRTSKTKTLTKSHKTPLIQKLDAQKIIHK